MEGEAVAIKEGFDGILKHYKVPGEYFGERALLYSEPRAASIQVISENLLLASIDKDTFSRLLGPMEEILKRNIEQTYVGSPSRKE